MKENLENGKKIILSFGNLGKKTSGSGLSVVWISMNAVKNLAELMDLVRKKLQMN